MCDAIICCYVAGLIHYVTQFVCDVTDTNRDIITGYYPSTSYQVPQYTCHTLQCVMQ